MAEEKNQEKGRSSGRMLLVSSGIFSSRLLGLARDCTFAAVWGTSPVLAAFLTAFTIPNLLRALFGEGAFSAAFVPAFSARLEHDGKAAAWQLAMRTVSVLATVLFAALVLFTILAVLSFPFVGDPLARDVLRLLPWVMPYAFLICLTAALTGILNSLHRFAWPAFSQTFLNIAFIAAALLAVFFAAPEGTPSVWFLVAGLLAAGAAQLGLLAVVCHREGGRFRYAPVLSDPAVRKVFGLMTPALLGAGVVQINVVVDRALALSLGEVAVTTLYLSQHLVYLPVGLFAVAAATVSLPAMSREFARGDHSRMLGTLHHGLKQAWFLSLPAFVMLVVLHQAVISLLFQRGNFTADDAMATARTLLFYLPGIPAFVGVKIAIAPFHARQDTLTPVKIAGFCVVLNVILNLVLMQFLAQGGLALATSICSWVNMILLFHCLRDRIGSLEMRKIVPGLARLSAAALGSGAVCAIIALCVKSLALPGTTGRIMLVAVPGFLGGVAYLALAWVLKCGEIEVIREPAGKFWRRFSER